MAIIVCVCWAEPQSRPEGKRGAGVKGQRRAGQGQRQKGGGVERDPAQMVAHMMKEFDKDGDNKLDVRELTAMFTTMRQRRSEGSRAGGAERRPGGNAGKKPLRDGGDNGKKGAPSRIRRTRGGDEAIPGGDKPKRPSAE